MSQSWSSRLHIVLRNMYKFSFEPVFLQRLLFIEVSIIFVVPTFGTVFIIRRHPNAARGFKFSALRESYFSNYSHQSLLVCLNLGNVVLQPPVPPGWLSISSTTLEGLLLFYLHVASVFLLCIYNIYMGL